MTDGVACRAPESFSSWRDMARTLLLKGCRPTDVMWLAADENSLFGEEGLLTADSPSLQAGTAAGLTVPREFVGLATKASLHRDFDKWALLYRLLWRLQHENRGLLQVRTDSDVIRLHRLEGEVRRDCHKMKAFVRFRKDADERYVAWHQPDHLITEAVAPFFARRFSAMTWAILTPDRSAYWDQQTLRFGPGLPRSHAPDSDELEDLWSTYYANIFNPARIKLSAMVSEMPKKYWHTMPETALIQKLLEEAPQRVERMREHSAEEGPLPAQVVAEALAGGAGLGQLAALATDCRGCELCRSATQTVFGRGPVNARLVLVGEQPGDQEDRVGEPFVGPAGQLLRKCLRRVGIDIADVYLTNTVKHFRWEPSPQGGTKRLHKRATWRQIDTCKPWLEAELKLLKPKVMVLLGGTALQAIMGAGASVQDSRGRTLQCEWADHTVATVHPSSLLRMRDNREQMREIDKFCRDLQWAKQFL